MKKNQSSGNSSNSNLSDRTQIAKDEVSPSTIKVISEQYDNQIKSLSYEESLSALDDLISLLQNDTVALEDLQRSYLLGNLYLDHCEKLLNDTEQEITELSNDELQEINPT